MPHHKANHSSLSHTLNRLADIQAALFELGHADSRITVRNAADQAIAVELLALDTIARCFYWRPRDYAGADFASTDQQSLLAGSRFRFQAQGYGGVQIDFHVDRPRITHADDGSPALISPFPKQLIRVQRRNAFRVQVVNAPRLIATGIWQPDELSEPLRFQVRDLSIDGIGMRTNHPLSVLPPRGSRMERLALNFDKHGDMVVDLEVHHLYPLGGQQEEASDDTDAASPTLSPSHLGGSFIGLNARQKTWLQKIVWAIEKAR